MKTTLVQKVMCVAFRFEKLKRFLLDNRANAPPERRYRRFNFIK